MNKNKVLNIILISLIVIILIILALIGVDFYQDKVYENTYIINLVGLKNITIYEGDLYNEPGYNAMDMYGNDKTSSVKVLGSVDSNVVGEYKITYYINSFFKKNEVIRIVNVVEDPLKNIVFSLKGDSSINLKLDDEYQELGFLCVDKNNVDCSSNVVVDSNVLINKIGNYDVNYILKIDNKEKVLTRSVTVSGPSYEYSLDNDKIVNTDVVITFQSNISNLDYIVTPNGDKVYSDLVIYRVLENGNYQFVVYDKNAVSEEANVLINNIDKESPKGSCKAIINGNNTTYSVSATDNRKVVEYIHADYPNKVYKENSFVINSRIENGAVVVYDEASNSTKIVCDTDYAYLGVTGSSVYEYNSETLKYWIEKNDYYIVHVWMDDAYDQLKTALPSSFGTLATPENILKNEISKMGYSNKGMVALNGSGFVSEQFDQSFYQMIPAWKNTAVTPIVIHNGVVLRNFTNHALPTKKYFTYGLARDGNLKYYSFDDVSNVVINQQTAQSIVNDGVKYSFGFSPILVSNNKRVVNDSQYDVRRQAIGQIDKNNFVIISSSSLSLNQIADKMVSLGCHTGLNLDGGGSVNLFYKGNTNDIVSLKKTDRAVADVLYFVEK